MRTASVQRPNRLDCYSECGADVAVAALAGDVEVLVDDAAATTTSSRHPDGPERVGYAVGADQPLRPVRLQGFWNTLEDFLYEQQWSDFQRDSYDHWDRDAWRDCKRKNLVHIKFNNRRASAGTWHGQNDGRVVSRKKGRLTSQHPRRSGRLNFTRSWLLAGVLGVNAVSAHCQLYIHDAVPSRWQLSGVGNDTNDPPAVTPDTIQANFPPEAYLLSYAAFGVLLVLIAKRTPSHRYQDPVFFSSVALGIIAVITHVYLGSSLLSSLCKIAPIALLYSSLINVAASRIWPLTSCGIDDENGSVEDISEKLRLAH